MAITLSSITEKDSASVDRKVSAELDSADSTYQPAGVIYSHKVAVAQDRAATVLAAQPGFLGLAIRQDTIATIAEANDKAAPPRLDANGAMRVYLNGALDADIDSVYARPYSPGATPWSYRKRFTTTAGEVVVSAPGAGFRLVITNCRISCRGTTAGTISVFEDTDGGGDLDTSEKAVADDDFAPTAAMPTGSKSGPLHVVFTENKGLYVISSAGISFTLMVDGFVEAMPA
jgi:hypothetical protein